MDPKSTNGKLTKRKTKQEDRNNLIWRKEGSLQKENEVSTGTDQNEQTPLNTLRNPKKLLADDNKNNNKVKRKIS